MSLKDSLQNIYQLNSAEGMAIQVRPWNKFSINTRDDHYG